LNKTSTGKYQTTDDQKKKLRYETDKHQPFRLAVQQEITEGLS
jgi:hypothetical protein